MFPFYYTIPNLNKIIGISLNAKQKQLENRIEAWTIAGPLIMVLTLLVVLINPLYHQLSLPVIALLGLICCWKWKIPGLALSLTILFSFSIYQLIQYPDKILWNASLSSAIGLTFCITALSYKEISTIFSEMSEEELVKQQNLKFADEKVIALEKRAQEAEKTLKNHTQILQDQLAEKIASLKSYETLHTKSREDVLLLNNQLAEKHNTLKSYETLITMAREEVLHINKQNESLAQELHKLRNQSELLRQEFEEISILRQDEKLAFEKLQEKEAIHHEAIQNLKASLTNYEKEILSLRSLDQQKNLQIEEHVNSIQNLQSQNTIHQQEILQYRQKSEALLSVCEKKEASLAEQIIVYETKCAQAETTIKQLESELAEIQRPITIVDDREVRKVEGLYFQLKEQFDEKDKILEDTRRQLFLNQEELARCRKELDALLLYGAGDETQIKLDSHVLKTADELTSIKNHYEQELEGLQDLVGHLILKEPGAKPQKQLEEKEKTDPLKEKTDPLKEKTEQLKEKTESKKKGPKQKKTTEWANTILSRWSGPHDHSQ